MKTPGFCLMLLGAGALASGACSSSRPSPPPRQEQEIRPLDAAAAAAKLSGAWQFALDRGGQSLEGWLHFSLSEGLLVGTLTGPDGNPREISKVVVKGDKVTWEVKTDNATQSYQGTLKGSSMEGTLKMSRASRGGRGAGGAPEGDEGGDRSGGPPPGGGRRGGGGGRRGGRGGGSAGEIRWRAFRSTDAPPVTPLPASPPGR